MSSWDTLAAEGRITADVDIGHLTSYKLGGAAAWFVEVESAGDLDGVVRQANRRELEILMLGRGSNLLVADAGFDGLVVRLGGHFKDIDIGAGGVVTAGAAVSLPVLARASVHAGFGGLEFYVGIPGSVGGAVAMNAGFHGGETAEVLASASVMDLRTARTRVTGLDELDFGYRRSSIGEFDAVLSGTFRLAPADVEESLARMREVTQWRKERQPGGTFNAGSVFKNPPGQFAGRIIDELGLKGLGRGGASVSHRHANFIVADAEATAQDVYDLVHAIRSTVHKARGLLLEPELRFCGRFRPAPDEVGS